MAIPSFQGVAGGDINPSRFVKLSTAANKTVLEADANNRPFGISHESTKEAPIANASALAAKADDPIAVYGLGQFALLELGTGGCTRGDTLKSDADGKGVTGTAAGDWIGAEALESGAAGEKVLVQVVRYKLS